MRWEVRTMPSRTSWFSRTLFCKNLARFWPIWAMALAIWSFTLPVNLLLVVSRDTYKGGMSASQYFADVSVLETASGGILYALVFGLLAAMAVFAYLYQSRSVGMMHALPLKREGLFLTGYLSGLVMAVGPLVVTFLTTLAAEAAMGAVNAGALCMWLVVQLMLVLFFYSFAVFCAMFTGSLLALPAFYGVLNLLVLGIYTLVDGLLSQFLYGYSRVEGFANAAEMLTPTAYLASRLRLERRWDDAGNILTATFHGLAPALCYAAVGLLLCYAALVLYRRRHVETAGDVVSVHWIRPIFKYGVAFCAALAGGVVLYYYFFQYMLPNSPLTFLILLLPCGAIGYFVAEMLLQKSFRAFARWKGCLVFLAALAAVLTGVWLDPIGFSAWTPSAGQVGSVLVYAGSAAPYDGGNSGSWVVEDPEQIEAVIEIHAALAAQRDTLRGWTGTGELPAETVTDAAEGLTFDVETEGQSSFNVDYYTMADGRTISRSYSFPVTQALLEDPTSYAAMLQTFLNRPEDVVKRYFGGAEKGKLAMVGIELYNTVTENFESVTVPDAGMEAMLAAVKSDMEAGRLGRRFLLENRERMETCYYNDMNFGFYDFAGTVEAARVTGAAVRAERESWETRVTLQTTATDTLAELERQGILDDTHRLLTQAEWQSIRD